MDCIYCYRDHEKVSILDIDTFKLCLNNIVSHIDQDTSITVIFHGGEPLLAGYDFYEQAFEFIKNIDRTIYVGIQTNLTLLDDKTISLFKANGCNFGASLDGDLLTNDMQRKFPKSDSRSCYEVVVKNIEKLNALDMSTGIISVLHDSNLDPETYFSFAKGQNVWSIGFSPMFLKTGDQILAPDREKLSAFLIDLYELWIADSNPPNFDFFTRIVHSLCGEPLEKECTYSENCSTHLFAVDVAGSVYPCTHFLGDQDYCYGNLLTTSFFDIWSSKVRLELCKRSEKVYEACQPCKHWTICYGGCMSQGEKDIYDKDYFCPVYKRIYSHIEQSLKELNILN